MDFDQRSEVVFNNGLFPIYVLHSGHTSKLGPFAHFHIVGAVEESELLAPPSNSESAMGPLKRQLNNPILIFGGMPSWNHLSDGVALQEPSAKCPEFPQGGQNNLEFFVFNVEVQSGGLIVAEAL